MANEDLNRMFQWAVDTCNAGNVGYSNKYRNGSINPNTGLVSYDCSSFVWWALKNGGWQNIGTDADSPGFYARRNAGSAWMCPQLISWGFTEYTFGSVETLPGDILWKESSSNDAHTEIVYEGSPAGQRAVRTMGAHTSRAPVADQVSIIPTAQDKGWQKIYRWGSGGATGYGLSKYVIAALLGNFWRESKENPGAEQANHVGYGLAQWSWDRRTALENWLSSQGLPYYDPIGQLDYLVNVDPHWTAIHDPNGYASLQDFLHSTSTDIDALTASFFYAFEEPGDDSLPERQQYAHTLIEYATQHFNDPNITTWVIKTTIGDHMVKSEWENNAVMIYRYLSAGGGGGGGGGGRTNKMPIWMMLRPWWKLI